MVICLFGVGGARRRPHRASSLTISTGDCDVLLRSSHTKRSGISREMSLSMRVPSVAPCRAVPWVPSSKAQRGNGIGETHEEGGKVAFYIVSLLFITLFIYNIYIRYPNIHSIFMLFKVSSTSLPARRAFLTSSSVTISPFWAIGTFVYVYRSCPSTLPRRNS